jgi:multiple sugar transport system permease protein
MSSTTIGAPQQGTAKAGAARRTSRRKAASADQGGWRKWAAYLGIALIIIYCLLPFYWMLVSALRRPADVFETDVIPTPPSFQSFVDAFDPKNSFTRALGNSVFVAATVTVLTLLIGTFAAYALARLDFRGKNISLAVIIATSMFPGIAMVIPLFKLFTNINWINTYQALIIPAMSFALPLAVWNLTAFFRQMPAELEQAAMVDGCTQAQAFRKVIMPLAAPGVFTTAIIVFVAAWNEYIIALTMTNKSDYRTATVAVTFFTGTTGRDIPFGSIMAAGVILTVPLLIMVLLFQRRIVAGLTAGGVKS